MAEPGEKPKTTETVIEALRKERTDTADADAVTIAIAEIEAARDRELTAAERAALLKELSDSITSLEGRDIERDAARLRLQAELLKLKGELVSKDRGVLEKTGAVVGEKVGEVAGDLGSLTKRQFEKLITGETHSPNSSVAWKNRLMRFGGIVFIGWALYKASKWLTGGLKTGAEDKPGWFRKTLGWVATIVGLATFVKWAESTHKQQEALEKEESGTTKKGKEEEVTTSGADDLPDKMKLRPVYFGKFADTKKERREKFGFELSDPETSLRKGARLTFSCDLVREKLVEKITSAGVTTLEAMGMSMKYKNIDVGSTITFEDGATVPDSEGRPCKKFNIDSSRSKSGAAMSSLGLSYATDILIPVDKFKELMEKAWLNESVSISEEALRKYCVVPIPDWIESPSLSLLRDAIPIKSETEEEESS